MKKEMLEKVDNDLAIAKSLAEQTQRGLNRARSVDSEVSHGESAIVQMLLLVNRNLARIVYLLNDNEEQQT